jgi:hypothetical protein
LQAQPPSTVLYLRAFERTGHSSSSLLFASHIGTAHKPERVDEQNARSLSACRLPNKSLRKELLLLIITSSKPALQTCSRSSKRAGESLKPTRNQVNHRQLFCSEGREGTKNSPRPQRFSAVIARHRLVSRSKPATKKIRGKKS